MQMTLATVPNPLDNSLASAGVMAFLALAVAIAASDAHANNTAGDALVSSGFIYDSAPYPACHASTIVETPSGLVAAWFGGTHERHPDVGIWVARHDAAAWSTPEEVATGEAGGQRLPCWNPVLYQVPDGPLMLFYKVGPNPREWWGMLITSDDGGQSWSQPTRLPDQIYGPIKNKPITLTDGRILCPSSTEHDGWRVHFEWSSDRGQSWQRTPPLNDPEDIGAIQPSLLSYGDDRLQAVGRTRNSGVFSMWSEDNGQTWGPVTPLGLPNPSSGTDAVTLRDGRQLLVYNHSDTYKVRSPLNVAVSQDGHQWTAVLTLEDDPQAPAGFSYPAVIQASDGRVHITYTWQRERIRHVVLDPSQFSGEPIVDGQWPAGAPSVQL